MYEYEKIQWTTGDMSGGNRGLGGDEAVAGINAGDGVNFVTINGSSTPDIINIDRSSNIGRPGVWMFQVGNSMYFFANSGCHKCAFVRIYTGVHIKMFSHTSTQNLSHLSGKHNHIFIQLMAPNYIYPCKAV